MEFDDQVVVVTGAAGEIGQVIAKRFYDEGAQLILVDIDQVKLNQVISDQAFDSDKILSLKVDARDEEQVQNYVQSGVDRFGEINVFVHCVGMLGELGLASQLHPDDLRDVFSTNVVTAFLNYKYISEVMRRQRDGSILFIGSIFGLKASPVITPYVVAAHGLAGLTHTSALECSESGVRVNSICPAPVDTQWLRKVEQTLVPADASQAQRQLEQLIPMGRYAEINDVVELTLFLSSIRAKFITGVNYALDGGLSSR